MGRTVCQPSRFDATGARTSTRVPNAKRVLGLAAALSLTVGVVTTVTSPASAEPSVLPTAFAYNYGETETARSAGMGGALTALGAGVNAPFVNPAAMGLTRSYHISALGQFTPEAARQLYGGAIVDSTRKWSGGMSVVGGFMDPDGINRSQVDVRLAVAMAISKSFHLGVSGRYLNLDQEGVGPLGSSRASGGLVDPEDPGGRNALVNTLTFDAGLVIRATDALHFGVVGRNLSYPNNGLLPTVVGGGVGYGTNDFSIEVDGLVDITSYSKPNPRAMAGGEYLLVDRVPLRLGYRFDLLNGSGFEPSHQVTGGMGYLDKRFGVDASVRRTVAGPSATTVVVTLSYFVDAPMANPGPRSFSPRR